MIAIVSTSVYIKWISERMAYQSNYLRELGTPSKKKKCDKCYIRGVGSGRQNVTFLQVVFKIHFKPFWVILEKKNFGWKMGGYPNT